QDENARECGDDGSLHTAPLKNGKMTVDCMRTSRGSERCPDERFHLAGGSPILARSAPNLGSARSESKPGIPMKASEGWCSASARSSTRKAASASPSTPRIHASET